MNIRTLLGIGNRSKQESPDGRQPLSGRGGGWYEKPQAPQVTIGTGKWEPPLNGGTPADRKSRRPAA